MLEWFLRAAAGSDIRLRLATGNGVRVQALDGELILLVDEDGIAGAGLEMDSGKPRVKLDGDTLERGSAGLKAAVKITISDDEPASTDGADGDVWLEY